MDLDPYGAKLIATQDPLGEATKLVEMLKRHAADKLTTHTTAFEVYTRKVRTLPGEVPACRSLGAVGNREGRWVCVRRRPCAHKVCPSAPIPHTRAGQMCVGVR